MSARCQPVTNWQAAFMAMLPAIERSARQALRKYPRWEREEALQAVTAHAAAAYARLAQLDKAQLAYPGPLASYGLKSYRGGRLVGGRENSNDVGSQSCRRKHGCQAQPWQETLSQTHRSTPAELAALRIDFGDWLNTLSVRDRRLAHELARGEQTMHVAAMFRLTAGRVSQLRRQLYRSWRAFVGEEGAVVG